MFQHNKHQSGLVGGLMEIQVVPRLVFVLRHALYMDGDKNTDPKLKMGLFKRILMLVLLGTIVLSNY